MHYMRHYMHITCILHQYLLTLFVLAVPCPIGSTGASVPAGCTCPTGSVVATSTYPFYNSTCIAASCLEYYNRNPSSSSGTYTILVGGAMTQVYCDMSTTNGGSVGGWTLVAMRTRAVQMFTETAMTPVLPTDTGAGRIANIFTMANNNFPFSSIRYTNNDPNWAVATFASAQTFASLSASNPMYSQNAVVPAATVTSSVSTLRNYYWRAKSSSVAQFSDSGDYGFMVFTVAAPITSGDGWDVSYPTWILAGTDNSYDPSAYSNVASGLSISGSGCHWWGSCLSYMHVQTYVWLR